MSRIFELFTSEYVRITLIKNHKQTIEHKGAIKAVESPMIVEGYLTEEDDDYFFLGIQPGSIHAAVARDQMSTMEICEPSDLQDDLLSEFTDNENKNGMN